MIGKTLSHYKVLEKIGQGGMGEVYRAEDTNLSREVAIKVLPEQFTQDPQRLARFEREAKLLASLNHPNIAAIYGLEEADGVRFLALELVPGETLAERVAKGPLPVEEALEVCRQIAEGVEAAHEKGIIHRDLKPANVKVTPEGKVKILDFGLAKAFEDEVSFTDISQSPTLTEEMTRAGVILGTAAYMSPEQAKGKAVDKRADIFAFGAVLYELLTGKRAFQGETITETLGAIIHKEPDWNRLPGSVPSSIRFLLSRCLKKDAPRRLQHIDGARILIEEALSEPTAASVPGLGAPIHPPLWKRAIPWSLTGLVAVIAAVGFWILTRPEAEALTRFVITPPATAPLFRGGANELAISPDGRRIVYRAALQLYVRSLDEFSATPIAGTERSAGDHLFSSDGESVAFFTPEGLKKVSLVGGGPLTLSGVSSARGGSWVGDAIVFSSEGRLYRVSAAGGEPEILATPDTAKGEFYVDPEILPGGQALLFTIWTSTASQIALLFLETGEQKVLLAGRQARYAATGHVVYGLFDSGTLMAAPFDLARLEVTGDSVPVLEGVRGTTTAAIDYSFSRTGTLVYVPAGEGEEPFNLVWVNREGVVERLGTPPHDYWYPRLSLDGRRLAVRIGSDIWVHDISRQTLTRLSFEGVNDLPVWTPDGKRVTWRSNREGPGNLFWKLADGSGPAERLSTGEFRQNPSSWSPDGQTLAFYQRPGAGGPSDRDIWLLPLQGDRQPRPFLQTPFDESASVFSPDGRWLAYVSHESGRGEIYVQPFPGPGGKWQISTEGGQEPVWARSGELFYRSLGGQKMMAVEITTEPVFSAGTPQLVFEGSYQPSLGRIAMYDVTRDGQRFVMIEPRQGAEAPINVVLNWFEELKRLVPTP